MYSHNIFRLMDYSQRTPKYVHYDLVSTFRTNYPIITINHLSPKQLPFSIILKINRAAHTPMTLRGGVEMELTKQLPVLRFKCVTTTTTNDISADEHFHVSTSVKSLLFSGRSNDCIYDDDVESTIDLWQECAGIVYMDELGCWVLVQV